MESQEFKEILDQTYVFQRNQCVLIQGLRRDRTTNLIDEAIDHYDLFVVKLSGLLLNDDLMCIQSIAEQIAYSKGIEHVKSSIKNTLISIRNALAKTDKILIVIYDINEFAHKTSKQVLLYTLFELIEEDLCNLCVLGVTSALNFPEILEKRIRSRFSKRIFLLHSGSSNEKWDSLGRESSDKYNFNEIKFQLINQLRPVEKMVLSCFLKLYLRNKTLILHSAYDEFHRFMETRPLISFKLDKYTFTIISNHLQKLGLLKVRVKCAVKSYSELGLNFEVEQVVEEFCGINMEIPTSVQEWLRS